MVTWGTCPCTAGSLFSFQSTRAPYGEEPYHRGTPWTSALPWEAQHMPWKRWWMSTRGDWTGSGDGYAWGRQWQLMHCLHFPLIEPIFFFFFFFLDNGRPLLLLFLSLAEQFICLLAPPGQRGGSETQTPPICFFSSFDKGLDGVDHQHGDPG